MANDFMIVEKPALVTFLSLKNHHCTPFIQDNGRVAFKVSGNVAETLAELQENPLIPILDFIQRMNAVKSVIFTLKEKGNLSCLLMKQ